MTIKKQWSVALNDGQSRNVNRFLEQTVGNRKADKHVVKSELPQLPELLRLHLSDLST